MQEKYRAKLQRVFFGTAPKYLLDAPVELTSRAFALQGMEYTYDGPLPNGIINLNYVQFIQDMYVLDIDRIKDYDGLTAEEAKRASGIFMRSEFYEWIQDPQKDNRQKLFKCLYYKGLLMAFVKTYDIEIIDNQVAFIKELLDTEDYYTKLIEQEVTEHKIPAEKAAIKFKEILSVNQQAMLITHLKDNKYIDKPELFVGFLVGKNDAQGVNIISGMEGSLSYLMYELYQASLIKLTSGKAYHQHIEMSLCPFSQQKEKGQIKYYIRKMQRNKSMKASTIKDLTQFVKKLNNVPLLLFFFPLLLFAS